MTKTENLLARKGVSYEELKSLLKNRRKTVKVSQPRVSKSYRFAIVSDTHLCDKGCAIEELHQFYHMCKEQGIKDIVHAGDIVAGMNVYKGQVNDLVAFGLDAQVKYVVKQYPQIEGITTYFITGNHCESFQTHAGADVGELISERRPDLKYLGLHDAQVVLNGVSIGLHHGAKGVPYAVSYHMQKYVEKIGAGQKPQIYVLGHYHSSFYMFYRGIHCFLPGCWQRANAFSVRLGLPECIGGWIIDLQIEDDKRNTIRSINQKFVAFY